MYAFYRTSTHFSHTDLHLGSTTYARCALSSISFIQHLLMLCFLNSVILVSGADGPPVNFKDVLQRSSSSGHGAVSIVAVDTRPSRPALPSWYMKTLCSVCALPNNTERVATEESSCTSTERPGRTSFVQISMISSLYAHYFLIE